jgi:hypothetical protein
VKPEHDARFRRIAEDFLERPGGDYAELLRRGRVSSPEGVDPEEWRAEIRAKARADKIRVIPLRDGDRAIAARHRKIPEDRELQELSREFQRAEVLRGLSKRARALGHEVDRWLRHDLESIAICTRCGYRIYARFDAAPPVIDGEALEPARAGDRSDSAAWFGVISGRVGAHRDPDLGVLSALGLAGLPSAASVLEDGEGTVDLAALLLAAERDRDLVRVTPARTLARRWRTHRGTTGTIATVRVSRSRNHLSLT